MDINKHRIRFQLNTVSDITLIDPETRKNVASSTTQQAHNSFTGQLKIVREVPFIVSKGNTTTNATVYITKNPVLDLLGLDLTEAL